MEDTFHDPDAVNLSADDADSFNMDVTRSDEDEKKMVINRNTKFRESTFLKLRRALRGLRRQHVKVVICSKL